MEIKTKRKMKMTMLLIRRMRISRCKQISMERCTQMNHKSKERASKMVRNNLIKKWETWMMKRDRLT